jgi:Tautomerase enzyme
VVFIRIIAGEWRDTSHKMAVYRAIADRLSKAPGLRREDMQVLISPNDCDDWSPDSAPSHRMSGKANLK